MSKIIDFTNADHGLRDYGGSDAKKSIIYNGEHYMLKFAEEKQKVSTVVTASAAAMAFIATFFFIIYPSLF